MSTPEAVHAFTSININYLPRARVLGRSLRDHHPEVKFHLMLSDELPDWFDIKNEPFDSVIQIKDLGVENWESWMYKHDVVEMCTAVKPFAFLHIMKNTDAKKIFYFDPDVVVFSRFDELISDLDVQSGILTPHVCKPETIESAIVDNEMSCLRHGINNLGFLAVNTTGQGKELIEWWANRLEKYCYDDIPRGLFTDQRWMDFAHVFFDKVKIDRGPQYNVATWNYTTRVISGDMKNGVLVDDIPLCFHHFSGFTNGAAEMMQGKYASGMQVIEELYAWYREECERAGQSELSKIKWPYAFYSNGQPVERVHRLLYREKMDLQKAFPEPLSCEHGENSSKSYYDWIMNNQDRVYGVSNNVGFSDFIIATEQSLYGYINNTGKLRNITKKVINKIIYINFAILKKLISLLK